MKLKETFVVLIALFIISTALAVPIADTANDASKPKAVIEKEGIIKKTIKDFVEAKQFVVEPVETDDDDDDDDSEVYDYANSILGVGTSSKKLTALIPADLSALSGTDTRHIIGFVPLNAPHHGALVIPAGAFRVVGQANVSIKETDENNEEDKDNQLSEEERAIRRRRRYRKRNNKGSLTRRRRRKGDNEKRRKNYYNSSSTQSNRRKTGSRYENDGYRRKPQRRRRPYYSDYDY